MTWIVAWLASSVAFLVGLVSGYLAGLRRGRLDVLLPTRELERVFELWRTVHGREKQQPGGDWVNQELPR